jgi:transcriptional regulator with XRE-family HTH domain
MPDDGVTMSAQPHTVVPAPDDAASTELQRLLQTGPFEAALREAIKVRGLGLTRIHDRLRRLGVRVSLATLSYWQSGRSRPERRDSLLALAQLERVLEVPAGSLSALLGPPRPRGRWFGKPAESPDIARWWPDQGAVDELVHEVDTRWDERLTRISQHDTERVGPDREELSFVSRQVLRAEEDGADRWVVIMHLDEHDRQLPLVRPRRHCRLGRVVSKPEDGLLVTELLFDRPLARGETIITEHELINRAPYPLATNYERKFRLPVREFVLEVCFDPAAVPARVVQYSKLPDGSERERQVAVDDSHSAHAIALNFGPGCYGFRWDWE